ncbi:hypothetical protein SGLAM104S_10484 [Streptomyces glaucescens]
MTIRASPAATRRVMAVSAPTSRSAARRRSRRSPPKRTAVAMKTSTGTSSTTQAMTDEHDQDGVERFGRHGQPYSLPRPSPRRCVRASLPAR